MHRLGILGDVAPELRVPRWLANTNGDVTLASIDEPIIYLFAFQAWCSGCHSHGFPTLRAVGAALEGQGLSGQVKFIAVQTVFEGHEENTEDAARTAVADHGLAHIALGHDSGDLPTLMEDYRSGGTPWVSIIGPGPVRRVLFNDFNASAEDLTRLISEVLTETPGRDSPLVPDREDV